MPHYIMGIFNDIVNNKNVCSCPTFVLPGCFRNRGVSEEDSKAKKNPGSRSRIEFLSNMGFILAAVMTKVKIVYAAWWRY